MATVRELTRVPVAGDRVFVRTVQYGNFRGVVEFVSLNKSTYGVRSFVHLRGAPDVVLVTRRQVALTR